MARTATPVTTPLGSLTQRGARSGAACGSCGSPRVTHLSLTLTDGSAVQFVSCHHCEHRTWVDPEGAVPVETVLERTRRIR